MTRRFSTLRRAALKGAGSLAGRIAAGFAVARERLTGESEPAEAPAEPTVEPDEPAPEVRAVPVLAAIPEVDPPLVEPLARLGFKPAPGQYAGIEAYRGLWSALVALRWGLKTLVVTSAHPGEGKTTTAANLASVCARQGLKVVLIECDLRRPSLGRYFEIVKQIDLVDVLFEGEDWRLALQFSKTPGLYVLLGEKSFPKSGDSLGGPEMQRLLAEITAEYDFVILDTSPLLVSTDAVALAPIVDGLLLVVRPSRTDRDTVDEVVDRLREAGGTILGRVVNDPDAPASDPGP
jgi:capsular exopolysaccharide synthesis family protein